MIELLKLINISEEELAKRTKNNPTIKKWLGTLRFLGIIFLILNFFGKYYIKFKTLRTLTVLTFIGFVVYKSFDSPPAYVQLSIHQFFLTPFLILLVIFDYSNLKINSNRLSRINYLAVGLILLSIIIISTDMISEVVRESLSGFMFIAMLLLMINLTPYLYIIYTSDSSFLNGEKTPIPEDRYKFISFYTVICLFIICDMVSVF
tara:strand:+ start:1387 stop:2001 length:615 start_codon:yes stop_codon:yes gene_type:complete